MTIVNIAGGGLGILRRHIPKIAVIKRRSMAKRTSPGRTPKPRPKIEKERARSPESTNALNTQLAPQTQSQYLIEMLQSSNPKDEAIRAKFSKVLYVGDLCEGRTSLHRMHALKKLVDNVVPVNTGYHPKNMIVSVAHRIARRASLITGASRVNRGIIRRAEEPKIGMLWLDKPLQVRAETIDIFRRRHPGALVIAYSPDDMSNPQNVTGEHEEILSLLDIYFTTKSFNVDELKRRGCREVALIGNGYAEHIHKPIHLTSEERACIGSGLGFIGGYELERFCSLVHLAKNGYSSTVRGSFWKRAPFKCKSITLLPGDIHDTHYSAAISATDINLGFLRKCNRDLQTTRSVEIPACGGFMLAERTDEHLEMFREGIEAEFFDSNEELVEKVRFYMKHPEARQRVAMAGKTRCNKSGYGNISRMSSMLTEAIRLQRNL